MNLMDYDTTPLEERIEKIFESGWVNEFNYLEQLMLETRSCLSKLQQELQRKDNIIKQLKKHLEYEIEEWQDVSDEWTKAQVQEDKIILDKINELEGDNK